jgi:hypothetical protein
MHVDGNNVSSSDALAQQRPAAHPADFYARPMDRTMIPSFLSREGLDNLALIISITLMPSIFALLLASFALAFPDDSKR